jgi:hypothetical protein
VAARCLHATRIPSRDSPEEWTWRLCTAADSMWVSPRGNFGCHWQLAAADTLTRTVDLPITAVPQCVAFGKLRIAPCGHTAEALRHVSRLKPNHDARTRWQVGREVSSQLSQHRIVPQL